MVSDLPKQTVGLETEAIEITGTGLTVTPTVALFVQPFVKVPVTVNIAEPDGAKGTPSTAPPDQV